MHRSAVLSARQNWRRLIKAGRESGSDQSVAQLIAANRRDRRFALYFAAQIRQNTRPMRAMVSICLLNRLLI